MIVVTGFAIASAETREEMLKLSVEHVMRSRREPGCLEHGVYVDAQDENKLHFYEEWFDEDALRQHFALEPSQTFAKALRGLAQDVGKMRIYGTSRVKI